MARSSPIKSGVIGYGGAFNMGRGHLVEMRAAGMVPTAVCEIDPNRLAAAAQDFPGIEVYADVDDMLAKSQVDLLTIITPHNTHAPLALKCLNASRNVVSEKPIAITTDECDALIGAAKAHDVMLSAYHNRHWDGNILSAVDHVVNKRWIGDVVRIAIHFGGRAMPMDWWRSVRSLSGGVMYDWGVHLIEYAFQLLPGQTITEVSGFATNGYWAAHSGEPKAWQRDPIEDEARFIARTDKGVAIDMTITQLDAVGRPNMFEVLGTEGHYAMSFQNWTRTCVRRDGIRQVETGPQPPSETLKFYQNINDHLMRDDPLIITPELARRTLHMVDLAVQSARLGRALPTKYG